MKTLGGKYARIDDLIEGLRKDVAGLNQEVKLGRGNQSWLTAEKNKASKKVQDQIKQIQREVELELIQQRAEANDMIRPSDKYGARSYHAQMAQALAQGKNSEQLIDAFKNLDREQQQYKNEYIRIFGNRIDSDNNISWQQTVESAMTPEEQEQHAIFKEVEEFRGFVPTLNAHIENQVVNAMDGGEKSEHNLPVVDLFTDCRGTVEKRVTEVKINPIKD